MEEPVKNAPKSYNSPLRTEQKEQTHERILAATAEQLLEEGIEELSLPRAAKRAGVSVPTVYRHFPTEEALLRELTDWIDKRMQLTGMPDNVNEFGEWVPRLFASWDENEALIRARLLSRVHRQIHRETAQRRDEAVAKAMQEVTSELDPLDARRACGIIRLLISGGAWEMMHDSWDLTGEQAGEALAWATNVLVTELRRNPKSIREFTGRLAIEEEV